MLAMCFDHVVITVSAESYHIGTFPPVARLAHMLESRYTSRVPVYLSHKWSHISGTIIHDVEPQYFWDRWSDSTSGIY